MSTKKVANETPQPVKREYFVPAHGVNVQATSAEDAVAKALAKVKDNQKKVGDG